MTEEVASAVTGLPLSTRQDWCWEWTRSYSPTSFSIDLTEMAHLRGPLDTGALRDALAEIQTRHDALRLRLVDTGAPPLSVVRPRQELCPEPFPLEVVTVTDGRGAPEAVREVADRPFEFTRQLTRPTLVRLSPDDHVLVLGFHHLVFDGASGPALLAQLADAYNRRVDPGHTPAPAPAPFSYVDLIRRENTPEALAGTEARLAAWADRLRDHGATETLPGRPGATHPLAADYRSVPVEFAFDDIRRLRSAARRRRVTLYSLLLAALARAVGAVYERDRLVCSTLAHGRTRPGSATALGLFCNMVGFPVDLRQPSPDDLARHVNALVKEASTDAVEVPYGRLATTLLGREGDDAFYRSSLAQVEFRLSGVTGLFLDRPIDRLPFHGLDARLRAYPRTVPPLRYASPQAARASAATLFLDLRAEGDRLTGGLYYEAHRHDEHTVQAVVTGFRRSLDEHAPTAEAR
ncbi:condensation domain-containing protein [Streptomyces sp. URMC 123]|uniref:condensation domain-containing protein n=1 Tax=Streptomyces sp. URMC 123 TaxID=3423403 RepID=UPI003F199572